MPIGFDDTRAVGTIGRKPNRPIVQEYPLHWLTPVSNNDIIETQGNMAVAAPGREAVALKAFHRIAQRWKLNREQQATLLAASPRSIDRWKKGPERASLTKDQFERISYLLGIYSGLRAVLGDSPLANEWVTRENVDFGGRTPLGRMLAGNVGDLAAVRHYVDQWRAGW